MTSEEEAYIRNALFELDQLRSNILDGLTGKNDMYLRTVFLDNIDSAISNLRRLL